MHCDVALNAASHFVNTNTSHTLPTLSHITHTYSQETMSIGNVKEIFTDSIKEQVSEAASDAVSDAIDKVEVKKVDE